MKRTIVSVAASATAATAARPKRQHIHRSWFARLAMPLLAACIVLLGTMGFAAGVPVADADAGFSSTPQPALHPLAGGGYVIQTLAVLNEGPSINIVGAPNPSIDWGDGTTSTLNPPNEDPSIKYTVNQGPDACTATSGSLQVYAPGGACAFDLPLTVGGSLTGDHSYTKSGTYTVTVTYYTGFAIHYSTSWSVTIPGAPANATVDTLNLAVQQVYASPYAGASGAISFSPAPLGGGAATCPPTCNPTWSSGTTVTLTAAPAAGSSFAYWTSGECGKGGCISNCPKITNPCSVTLPQLAKWAESDWVVFQLVPDSAPPAITAHATTADGKPYVAGTWTNQSVTVSFSCADTGAVQSGIATNTVAGQTLTNETAGETIANTGACADNAGNAADAASFGPVQIDQTKPAISAAATTADGKPYVAGTWTNQSVTVNFGCADTGSVQSGVATNSVAGQTLTSETPQAGQSVTNAGTCADHAGNVAAPVTFGPVLIDKTPPTLACSASPSAIWPPNHKLVQVQASVGVSDSLSGAAGFALVSAVASGSASDVQGFDASSPTSGQVAANKDETYTLIYQGMDNAGNTASCSVTIGVPHDQGHQG